MNCIRNDRNRRSLHGQNVRKNTAVHVSIVLEYYRVGQNNWTLLKEYLNVPRGDIQNRSHTPDKELNILIHGLCDCV